MNDNPYAARFPAKTSSPGVPQDACDRRNRTQAPHQVHVTHAVPDDRVANTGESKA